MPVVCGIDSSTQSTKVELRDLDSGEVVGVASAPHPPTTPPRSEQDPAAWWDAFRAALDEAAVSAGRPRIAAVSVAGQQHGLVAVDADGNVVRPAKLWNDTESAQQADRLVAQLGAEEWARRTGSVPVASFTVTKLAWLREREPDNFERMRRVLLPHDWLTTELVGEPWTDRGDASGTGYWSPRTGSYDLGLLEIVAADRDWQTMLPQVAGPGAVVGACRHEGVRELLGETAVASGTGDNMGAALGLGLGPGDVAVSIGTSGTVFAVASSPTADASGAVAGFADAAGAFLPLVCTLNGTKVTDAVARLLGVAHDELSRLALAAPAGSGGLVLLPYLDGERTPNRPNAAGVLAGIRSDVSRERLARAAFEGVVCGLLDGVAALEAAGVDVSGRMLLVGGGSRSQAASQVLADLAQRPVEVRSGELVARGACVQAAAAVTGRAAVDVATGWQSGPTVVQEPVIDGASARAVRAAYARLRDGSTDSLTTDRP